MALMHIYYLEIWKGCVENRQKEYERLDTDLILPHYNTPGHTLSVREFLVAKHYCVGNLFTRSGSL